MESNLVFVNPESYEQDWWDQDILNDSHFIYGEEKNAIIDHQNVIIVYGIKLNPKDHRCYRVLVIAQAKHSVNKSLRIDCPRLLFNKNMSELMELGIINHLLTLCQKWMQFLSLKNLIPQLELAGNNAHSEKDNCFIIGEYEPSIPHCHIMARQTRDFKLHEEFEYLGPNPGELFNMRDGKMKYDPDKENRLVDYLRKEFQAYIFNHNK
jgi:hypothetical protein